MTASNPYQNVEPAFNQEIPNPSEPIYIFTVSYRFLDVIIGIKASVSRGWSA